MRYVRDLAPGQTSRVMVLDVRTGESTLIHESTELLLEAPNWTADGRLVLNGDGRLWQLDPMAGATPREIPLEGIPDLNNDHVLDPDGEHIYLSANDWQIYRASLDGGPVVRITGDDNGRLHFLHGVSPDGSTLAYIGLHFREDGSPGAGNVFLLGVDGAGERQLTFGDKPADGSEYSPDGAWIYFNTEAFSTEPGHAQIARVPVGGGVVEQLTFDERVNWFPHIAPDGSATIYLSYPTGTIGHPADLPVELRLVRGNDWNSREIVASFDGGQGTINVNSWSPTSTFVAYVTYPTGKI